MTKKISLRLPDDIFEKLSDEAALMRISISDVMREKMLREENSNSDSLKLSEPSENLQNQISEILSLVSKNEKNKHDADPTLIEILFLLRELFLQRDGGVIRKVDAKLDQLFGKERKKIL